MVADTWDGPGGFDRQNLTFMRKSIGQAMRKRESLFFLPNPANDKGKEASAGRVVTPRKIKIL